MPATNAPAAMVKTIRARVPATCPFGRAALPSRKLSPVQMSSAKINSAMERCVASLYCETDGSFTRPDVTIHQPMTP